LAWRDSLTGLEYLRRASDLRARPDLDLHAYQCHVFLDWRELYSTAEQPWDRLCDQLNGRGVPSLDDALVNLELQPVHDALRAAAGSGMVRSSPTWPSIRALWLSESQQEDRSGAREFFEAGVGALRELPARGAEGYISRSPENDLAASVQPANPGLLRAAFRERLRAAMRIPAIEALFPAPWTVAARRMLPSPSPQLTATAMWGPVLGWCALELLAESIDAENPERVALDLLTASAARALCPGLRRAGIRGRGGLARRRPHQSCAAHRGRHRQAGGRDDPSRVASNRVVVQAMSKTIEKALAEAEAAGYRVDLLRSPSSHKATGTQTDSVADTAALPSLPAQPDPAEPETKPPANSAVDPG
jgi:hypothetical protein